MKSSNSRRCVRLLATALTALLASCGSGGGGTTSITSGGSTGSGNTIATPTTNAAQIIVDSGSIATNCTTAEEANGCTNGSAIGSVNIAFVTVNVCLPGTTTCQSIDHVMVDTGSSGLRIMASAFTSVQPSQFTQVTVPADVSSSTVGGPLYECAQFADGFSWGTVRVADVSLAGKTAGSQNFQIIGDAASGTPPTACSGTGTQLDDAFAFGANGVIGVGLFIDDCITGFTCPTGQQLYFYFNCSGISSSSADTCTEAAVPAVNQVANPVAGFTTDNNGVIVELPSVATGGAATATGALVFGINTESNNTTATQTVYLVNSGASSQSTYIGDFYSTLTNTGGFGGTGTAWANSFFDSGSNGIFLPGTTIPCDNTYGWFLPSSTLSLSANLQGETDANTATGTIGTLTFSIANSTSLFSNANTAFSNLGGPVTACSSGTGSGTSSSANGGIDWGLPIFYGNNIFVGLETNNVTISGTVYSAPLWAF